MGQCFATDIGAHSAAHHWCTLSIACRPPNKLSSSEPRSHGTFDSNFNLIPVGATARGSEQCLRLPQSTQDREGVHTLREDCRQPYSLVFLAKQRTGAVGWWGSGDLGPLPRPASTRSISQAAAPGGVRCPIPSIALAVSVEGASAESYPPGLRSCHP